ncbi:TIGR00730 family Rossman fold protein [Tunicatimonas pelagia]|uniref:LOG family protein n=1 Tax=Tunicatimonas pelagia TaxID=931531 RepID=UPI002664E6E1|nr:TIGR00730 family Rossman fold protein [Tunicatimonas pelagia]WKN44518.1 TIGR00730 family Rossman fold protein [Tunicatimonas pelagia]
MNEINRVCVYCASSAKIDQKYFDATERLGKQLVTNQIEVVYGGGAVGLMGKLADTVLEHDGEVIGIMPQFMRNVELHHKKVSRFHFVADMHERKKRFLDGVDGLIALPGGCGTLEELMEVLTLKRLGILTQPIVILNTDGFYDPLETMLERCIDENFMAQEHRNMWTFVREPEEILNALREAPPWSKDAIQFATFKE